MLVGIVGTCHQVATATYITLGGTCQLVPETKVQIPYERIDVKLPLGLYEELERILRERRLWPSRQDFVIEAIKEKLAREGLADVSGRSRRMNR